MIKGLYISIILLLSNIDSIEKIILSLESMSGEVISEFINNESEIIINESLSKGNSFQMSKVLDSFFEEEKINQFKVIHKGEANNNLIYLLGEYSSQNNIYKVFLTLHFNKKSYSVLRLKIDKET